MRSIHTTAHRGRADFCRLCVPLVGCMLLTTTTPASSESRDALTTAQEEPASARESSRYAAETGEPDMQMEEIVVTGTHIRSAAPTSSPLHRYNRDDIALTGSSTLQDFVHDMTPNFGGGSNDALVRGTPGDSASSNNIGMGASVNLRGLGSGATLVLVNGQRLAPSSSIGDFVDISLIPLAAIESVEVLTDGASSIYGGDAVAGVTNFILRDDYSGVEAFVGYGAATGGGAEETRAGVTAGTNWDSGNLLVAYDWYGRDRLCVLDKDFSEPIGLDIDLLPQQERHAMLVSGRQELGLGVELFGHALYGQRDGAVTRSNTIDQPTRTTESETRQSSIILGLSADVFADWNVELTGAFSDVMNYSITPTVGTVPGPEREVNADQWSLEGKVTGSLFELPGGSLQVALGGTYREENLDSINLVQQVQDRDVQRTVSSAFAEIQVPIVGPEQNVPLVHRFDLNLSGRIDDYDDFGTSSNPKIGLVWAPIESLHLRGTWGTSFNPPDLGRIGAADTQAYVFTNDILNALLVQDPEIPNSQPALLVLGTDQLGPEEGTSWTLGFDTEAELGPGNMRLSMTWFDIEFDDRINLVQVPGGAYNVYNIGLCCADLLPAGVFIGDPSGAEVQAVIDAARNEAGFYDQFGLYNGDPESIGMIANIKLMNLARTVTRGLDLDWAYDVETSSGALSFTLNGTWVDRFSTQNSDTTPLTQKVGTVFYPVDLRLRGGVAWTNSSFTAATFVQHVANYVDDRPTIPIRLPSWTTVDLNLAYAIDNSGPAWAQGLKFNLGMTNLFDREPPFIGNDFQFGILGYDPANANPLGRFVTFRVTKSFVRQ